MHGGNLEEKPVTKADIAFLEPLTREVIRAISNIIINNQGAITTIQELVDWIEPNRGRSVQIGGAAAVIVIIVTTTILVSRLMRK